MGTKKISREKRKVSTCYTLTPNALDMLDELCANYDVTHSAMVEKIIIEYFKNNKQENNGKNETMAN